DLGEVREPDRSRGWFLRLGRVEQREEVRLDPGPLLLVEERRVEQEPVVFRAEPAAGLRDPALAEDHRLPALAERPANHGPLLERDPQHHAPLRVAAKRTARPSAGG